MNAKHATLLFLSSLFLSAAPMQADTREYHLPIGDPARSQREIEVFIDTIVETDSGDTLMPAELAVRLADVRLLFIGENHTSHEFHQVQLRTIQELHRAGRKVLIGLEMYPYTDQKHLDAWVSGLYSEAGFLELSKWYETWSYHWNYYREIFLFAQEHALPMYAINAPREVIKEVRKKGFDKLTEEEAVHIPSEIDTDSEEHRQLFKAFFDEDDPIHASMTEAMWDGMFSAQCAWDATMGFNAIKALALHDEPEAIMVVLIGGGHVTYGLGIERQAKRWYDGGMASLIPVPPKDDEGEVIGTVRASYADFVWGVPYENDTLYPTLGLSSSPVEGEDVRKVIYVSEDSVAESSGFEVGDVLLAMDGVALRGRQLNRRMADLRWGDTSVLKIRRGEETRDVAVHFRRQLPDEAGEDEPSEE